MIFNSFLFSLKISISGGSLKFSTIDNLNPLCTYVCSNQKNENEKLVLRKGLLLKHVLRHWKTLRKFV